MCTLLVVFDSITKNIQNESQMSVIIFLLLLLPVLPVSFLLDFLFFLLSRCWFVFVFCNKKRPLRTFHSKWPNFSQKAGTMFLIFFFRASPKPNFFTCFTGTNTNLKIIITQDIVCVNFVFPYFVFLIKLSNHECCYRHRFHTLFNVSRFIHLF